MFKNLTNIANLMRTASQMGDKLATLKGQLETRRVYGSATEGGHSVNVELNGLGVMQSMDVSPSLLSVEQKATLQQLTIQAMNQAVAAAKQMHVDAIRQLTNGLDIPGIDNILTEMAR